jgi:hypothetical protein
MSETQITSLVIEGVKSLIVRELELTPAKEGVDIQVGPQLKTYKDLNGFPIFPTGTKSFLSKHLNKEIFTYLRKLKDNSGYSFKQAIFTGCKIPDSTIGVYAGSQDSYKVFAKLFDKIIEDYHGYKPTDKHVSDMDKNKLITPKFDDYTAKLVTKIKISINRNLADYPFGT